MSEALSTTDLTVYRGETKILDRLSLRVDEAETVAVLGPSGAGKSTLLRALLGLLVPREGQVRVGGRLVSDGKEILVRAEARGLSVVFQELALWPHMTVEQNLLFVLSSGRGVGPQRQKHVAVAMLERVGLLAKKDRRPGQLSGGERQRVAIARALVGAPSAVLLDEPLASLDVLLKRELLELLSVMLKERKTAALYITHDPREARIIADRIVVIEKGRCVYAGKMQQIPADHSSEFVRALREA